MKALTSNTNFTGLSWSGFFITIVMTPWVNSDSLVIPKLVILFCLSLYYFPKILNFRKELFASTETKILTFVSLFIIFQMLLTLRMSDAPIEQQVFGRTGRGLGFLTEVSLIIILISAAIFIERTKLRTLFLSIIVACFISSLYSVFQRFNLDIFDWNTKTNGIIGTLGNPNFQSSFAAMALIPTFVYFSSFKNGKLITAIALVPIVSLIYLSESTQGYLTVLISILCFAIIYFWYKKRSFFLMSLILLGFSIIAIIAGMLNKWYLAPYLYKVSVRSRGEFFKTSINIANDNPVFGVGLDSLSDYYLLYREKPTSSSIGEFTDHSHNLWLQYASVGGYPLAILQFLIVLLVFACFLKLFRRTIVFQRDVTALFCSWICYQMQALISPANISMLMWNALISGSVIGLVSFRSENKQEKATIQRSNLQLTRPFSLFLLMIGLLFCYPYFDTDRQQLKSARSGDGNLAIKAALAYPESSIRYVRIGEELLNSNLPLQALELGRAAIKFNPNSTSAWGLILVNNYAPRIERIKAQKEIMRLDPFNQKIRDLVIPETKVS